MEKIIDETKFPWQRRSVQIHLNFFWRVAYMIPKDSYIVYIYEGTYIRVKTIKCPHTLSWLSKRGSIFTTKNPIIYV